MPGYRKKGNGFQKKRRNDRIIHYPKKRDQIIKYAGYGYSAYKLATKLAKLVNVEHKYLDQSLNNNVDSNGVLVGINAVPQGDTDQTRDGDSLKMQRVLIRGHASYVTAPMSFRLMVIFDKQNKIVAPANILSSVGSANATNSFKVWDNRFESRVLFDKTYDFTPGGMEHRTVDLSIPINLHTQYAAGTTVPTSGRLWCLMISDDPVAPGVVFQGEARLIFTDN